jgi:hypothetical protein
MYGIEDIHSRISFLLGPSCSVSWFPEAHTRAIFPIQRDYLPFDLQENIRYQATPVQYRIKHGREDVLARNKCLSPVKYHIYKLEVLRVLVLPADA